MQEDQIASILKEDKFFKKFKWSIVFEDQIPEIIPSNVLYIFLIPNGQLKTGNDGNQTSLGHWCLLDSLKSTKKLRTPVISYYDPYGAPPSSSTYQKIAGTALINDWKIFINKVNSQLSSTSICGPIVSYVGLLRARGFTYSEINRLKLSKSQRINAITIVDIINSLLPRKAEKVLRFSMDFL